MTKPTKPQFTVRPTAYRAWDGRKMVDVQTLSWNAGGMLWHGAGGQMGWAWINPEYKGWSESNPKPGEGDIYPVMQWTGLKDEEGIDIYEGDILKVPMHKFFGEGQHKQGVVEWSDFLLGYSFPNCTYGYKHPSMKVIGNIFQNPDLLES